MRNISVAVLLVAACSQKVYSPPSQAYGLVPLSTLSPGQGAMDVEVSRHADLWDPPINAGNGRLRTGIGRNSEVSVEGAAMFVEDDGPSMADRTLYSGRAGARHTPTPGFTVFGGLGGGYAPAGGTFAAVDAGFSVGYENCTAVPTAQFSGYLSEPLAPRPVDVTDGDNVKTYDTPEQTVGVVIRGGVRVSLSPSRCRAGEQVPWITLGIGSTSMMDRDSDASLLGFGLGVELPL